LAQCTTPETEGSVSGVLNKCVRGLVTPFHLGVLMYEWCVGKAASNWEALYVSWPCQVARESGRESGLSQPRTVSRAWPRRPIWAVSVGHYQRSPSSSPSTPAHHRQTTL